MAIARVKMGLGDIASMKEGHDDNRVKPTLYAECADLVKVVAVYVGIHAKQSSHNGAHGVLECPRE